MGGSRRVPSRILFVCSLNAVRSPMAAALARRLAGIEADSAGVEAAPLDPFAVAVMGEIGIELGGHTPRRLADIPSGSYARVVALSAPAQAAAQRLFPAIDYWPVPDPAQADGSREQRLAAYRALRETLAGLVRRRLGSDS